MTPHRISGSKVALVALCPFPGRADIAPPPRVEREDSEEGTSDHDAIARTIETGDEEPRSPKHAAWLADFWAERRGDGWRAEQVFAVDPETGRAMALPSSGEHRDYSAVPEGWIPLTVDAVLVVGRTAKVIDWKTGHAAHVAPAAGNAQLATAALAVAGAYGCTRVHVAIVKVGEHGLSEDGAELDALDLEDWRERLASIVRAIPGGEPVAGPHCRGHFCDHFGRCPATEAALATAAPATDGPHGSGRRLPVVTEASAITSPEHAAHLYALWRAAKARLDLIGGALRVYAEQTGAIEVGDGVVWGPRSTQRESIDLSTRAAVDALKTQLGPAWERAVTLDTSKAAIKRAAAAVKAETGETIAAIEERTVAALKSAGAISVSRSTKFEEHKPRSAKAEAA